MSAEVAACTCEALRLEVRHWHAEATVARAEVARLRGGDQGSGAWLMEPPPLAAGQMAWETFWSETLRRWLAPTLYAQPSPPTPLHRFWSVPHTKPPQPQAPALLTERP